MWQRIRKLTAEAAEFHAEVAEKALCVPLRKPPLPLRLRSSSVSPQAINAWNKKSARLFTIAPAEQHSNSLRLNASELAAALLQARSKVRKANLHAPDPS